MKTFVLLFTVFFLFINGWVYITPPDLTADAVAAPTGKIDKSAVAADAAKGRQLVDEYGITEALGPLAPVAMSPFFGLTCLSGTSILCDWGWLPENDFLQGNEVLNNWLVFLLFGALTIATSVPRLVSVSKVFAEAMDRVETYAGIISYGVILMAAAQNQPGDEQAFVYTAGFISITQSGLLTIAAAINIFVISSVRLFFELLVLISPIPTLDAIFECTNKGIAGIIACIYAFNPWLAFVLNIIIFLICLVIFKWVNRRLKYLKATLLEPILLGIIRKLLGRETYDPDWKAKRRYGRHVPGLELVVKCFPMRKLGKIKTKDRCYLAFGSDGVALIKPYLLRAPLVKRLDPADLSRDVQEGLTAYSVVLAENPDKPCELVFGRVYTEKLDTIKAKLNRPAQPETKTEAETESDAPEE